MNGIIYRISLWAVYLTILCILSKCFVIDVNCWFFFFFFFWFYWIKSLKCHINFYWFISTFDQCFRSSVGLSSSITNVLKLITLCNCFCSSSPASSSRFSASRVWCFGIISQYSWFWKSLNVADWGSEFSFFQAIHVTIDIIDISISIRPMTIKFGKQVHIG